MYLAITNSTNAREMYLAITNSTNARDVHSYY